MENASAERMFVDLEKLESVADKLLSDQEKVKLYEINRRKTQEALNRLNSSTSKPNVWTCLSHQFFYLPKSSIKKALQSDIYTLASEVENLRVETKRNIDQLHELEGKECLKGIGLHPLTRGELSSITGAVEKSFVLSKNSLDKDKKPTALAPGAIRSNGEINPFYDSTYIFPNDFPALSGRSESIPDQTKLTEQALECDPLFASAPATGECYVMCFDPRPDVTLALMKHAEVVGVVEGWCKMTQDCSERGLQWIQIFENRGEMMGCSNPHPHCQVWASDFIPSKALRSDSGQQDYFRRYHRPLLLDYARREQEADARMVVSNADWLCIVPWWAAWPFETLLLPRQRHVHRLDHLTPKERSSLADVLVRLLVAYDNLFETSCPYSFGFYQTPLQRSATSSPHWQLHASFLPPLLRSATVKKHMVGYELLAEVQRDLTPESAAKMLREAASREHYSRR